MRSASVWLSPSQEVRERLQFIVDRRNKIAHESDMIPSPYDELWPIDRQMATDAVDFIDNVAESIHSIITQ